MKTYLLKVLLGILCVSSMNAQVNAFQKQSTSEHIRHTISSWMKENDIPGAAVEIYINGIPHSYYFGYANRDKKIPVTEKTIFEIGSLTKIFTNLLLAEEVNSGKIKLDESIGQYIPDLSVVNSTLKNLTFLNLATHTTGLPFDVPEQIKTRSQLKNYFADWNPSSAIGSQWGYSNINIGLLGYALEAVTHQNINQMYRQKILLPLGMEPIAITVPKKYLMYYAQGYLENGKTVESSKLNVFPSAWAMKASGHDMLLFLKAATGLPGVPNTIAQAMKITQQSYVKTKDMEQGLGWIINNDIQKNSNILLYPPLEMNRGPLSAKFLTQTEQKHTGVTLIDKTGGTKGFRSYLGVIPSSKLGIVILANRYVPNSKITKIGREILSEINKNSF